MNQRGNNGGIRDRMDGSDMEPGGGLRNGLAGMHELLCYAYGLAARSYGAT